MYLNEVAKLFQQQQQQSQSQTS
uniref:Uncharacterized protein n=1 Tax=Arundo donax TaxID=35708 RepID=A0A0A9AKX3_ARUDO